MVVLESHLISTELEVKKSLFVVVVVLTFSFFFLILMDFPKHTGTISYVTFCNVRGDP